MHQGNSTHQMTTDKKVIVLYCFRILSMHLCMSSCNSLQISSPQSKYKQLL